MWDSIANFILRFRLLLIVVVALLTVFMGFQARKAENTYDFVKVVPPDDPEMVYFQQFLRTFGEDANVFAIGLQDSSVYKYQNFRQLYEFTQKIDNMEGVDTVISLPKVPLMQANQTTQRFEIRPLFEPFPQNQAQLDSLLALFAQQVFYKGQLINAENGATLIVVAINKTVLNSPKRQYLIKEIEELGAKFSTETQIKLHYAGVPYVRTTMASKVKQELNFFLMLSLGVTVVVMFLFFRSLAPIIVTLCVLGVIITWTVGFLGIFGYKITLLTGLLPPILVVIGIQNSTYFLTKYHQEFINHRDRFKALKIVIKKIGVVTLITNLTTAIGFVVLLTTRISILEEFGMIASLTIMCLFVISITLLPVIFSYLPDPNLKHTQHLEFPPMIAVLNWIVYLVENHRSKIYVVCLLIAGFSFFGVFKIKALAYMVDDLPRKSQLMQDLRFFEKNFKGVMPLEIVVDTGKRKGFRKYDNLQKLNELETYLGSMGSISPPISPITLIKAANQAYFGDSASYRLPTKRELPFLQKYLGETGQANSLSRSFLDSNQQKIRISMKVADLGSIKMDSLIRFKVIPEAERIFADANQRVEKKGTQIQIIGSDTLKNMADRDSIVQDTVQINATGTTLLFIKGNEYLISNLKSSLLLAIVLIAIIMGLLFRNLRIMILSLIPNMLPLLVVAGLMGYLNVPLKPSTALIFSIAFGIAVDDAIHFLAKYRQELLHHHFDVAEAIRVSIRETGMSMIYTSVVLFFGFVIFTASEFGGTIALGSLTSTTLLIAMLTNLVLLPSLLLSFSKGKADMGEDNSLLEDFEE